MYETESTSSTNSLRRFRNTIQIQNSGGTYDPINIIIQLISNELCKWQHKDREGEGGK